MEPQLIDIFGSSNNLNANVAVVGSINMITVTTKYYFDSLNPATKTVFLQEPSGQISF